MTDLAAPPVPADADLRKYPYLPLDVVRVRDSGLARGDLAVLGLAVLTWCVAWHQVPAGSLPDDDDELAWLLGYGRDVAGWRAQRERGALRGWRKHADGRLYHATVTEKVLDALGKRQRRLEASRIAHEAKRAQRDADRLRFARDSRASLISSSLLSPSRDVREREAPDVSGDTRAREAAGGAQRPAGERSEPPISDGTPGAGSPAGVPAAAIADPNDLTSALPAHAARPALRLVPEITALDRLKFARARINRDEGTWALAVEQHGVDAVLGAVLKAIDAGETPWWSVVAGHLEQTRTKGRPDDGMYYPPNVRFDAEGPHVIDSDGVRHRFRPTEKIADRQREGARRV